jgi:hypothetical protein
MVLVTVGLVAETDAKAVSRRITDVQLTFLIELLSELLFLFLEREV